MLIKKKSDDFRTNENSREFSEIGDLLSFIPTALSITFTTSLFVRIDNNSHLKYIFMKFCRNSNKGGNQYI